MNLKNILPNRRENMDMPLFPHIGQRILKTALAVLICLLIYWLRGYHGEEMRAEAPITAIICMQPFVRDTRKYAVNRFIGTIIGAVWGLALLFLLLAVPVLGTKLPLLYTLMAIGVLLSLYSAVLLRTPDVSGLAAIVFLCIVIAFPDIEDPLAKTGMRILDVFIGTSAAIAVNVFRLPRKKNHDLVFFVQTKDLVPDRFSNISPTVLFRLNYLYNDGAKICLISEHAPAFFALQMNPVKMNMPMIVMDGAAIYDTAENSYLQAETIPQEDFLIIRELLSDLEISYYIYTIHHNKVCIFHSGDMRPEEQAVYNQMKKSPYRSYLEG